MKKTLVYRIIFVLIFVILFALPTFANAAEKKSQLIVINKANNQLAFYDKGELVKTFDVGTGRTNALTPEGTFKIVNKIKNRPYYKGQIPGGDPRNPLGDRWLGLDARGTYGTTYGIHGNNNQSSIGKYVSAGCIRMHNDEVKWLFDQVELYTPVIIGSFKDFKEAAKQAGYSLKQVKPITVFFNQQQLEHENPLIIQDSQILIPLRDIFTALGATVTYDDKTKTITTIKDDRKTTLTINSKKVLVNDREINLEVQAKIINRHTYVPMDLVTKALGPKISWNQEKNRIDIIKVVSNEIGKPLPPSSINLILNGKLNPLEEQAILKNGTTLASLRGIAQELGATVTWHEETKTAIVQKEQTIIKVQLDSSTVDFDGKNLPLAVPAQIINDSIFVPVRFVSEALGSKVLWDPVTSTVEILTAIELDELDEPEEPDKTDETDETDEPDEPDEAK